ncbi:MAG TPA: insulinase family protein [Vicinamibacterales bacterium]|nr:insulinase family protein [Vicinamibacterales bacterium]
MRIRSPFPVICLGVALAGAVSVGAAQQPAPAAPPLDQQIPLDPAITAGRFANGLRYFIRTTKRPEKRAELRLVVDVGSIVEESDQLGLAHFVEHMAFNGTKNFPKQETVQFLESLGMRFGPSVNASTSFDETIYMLQVPTEKPEVLDRSFLILEDWAHGQTFDPAEIDKERGVIKEEWRIRRGAGARMQDKQLPILLKGSRYAERIPIGTIDVIDNFKHDRLIQFYKDWYRPDLMTVIAVGDFDPAAVEKMIKAHFEPLPASVSPKPRPNYPVPDHPGTLYTIATDTEATTANISIYSKLAARDPRTVGAYRQQMVEQLFSAMLGARFSELAQKPDAPFVGAGGSRGGFLGDKDVSTLSALVKGDAIEKTLEVLFTEAERVVRFGFTAGELERTKVNLMTGIDRALREKDNTPAGSIAGELVRHVTIGETVPGIAYEHDLYTRFLPAITLAEVNALAKEWVPDRNRVITVGAPQKDGFKVPAEAQLAAVGSAVIAREDITAYVDTVDAAPLLDPLPSPGAVVKSAAKEAFGITEWQLANGVKVILKPTDFREDEILFRATSYGGSSLASDADYVPASSASAVLSTGGIGKLSLIELRKKMTGKTASAAASILPYEEVLSGAASKKDLETMFQLIHLRFTQPRADPTAFSVMQGQMKPSLELQRASPAFLFSEALTSALRGDHPRTRPMTPETLAQMNLDKSLAFYKDRFADAGDFSFVFVGSFDLATMKPLVERYLGSLPSTGRKESWKDTGIRYATGVIEKRVDKGVEPQSRAAIVFTGPFKHDQEQRIAIRALGEVLQARLHEALREDLGGTYGVSAGASYAQIPVKEYSVSINFSCAPERTNELIKAAMQQVETLKANGPTEKEVTDAREKLLRDFETNSKQNGYWTSQLSLRYQSGEPVDSLFELPAHYKKVTPAMIQEAAKLYLNPANHVKVTLFPEKKS